jgi:tripartite-type tricarboxylate transporter receptor subunit TctC
MPYDLLKDFAPVSMLGTSPLMLFANASQYKTGDAKAFLQNSRIAGGPIALAHSGNGSISHLSAELMSSATGIKVNAIPYRGSAPALTDVAAGLVVGHFSTLASASPLLTAGKVSALMVTGSSRFGSMPDVPTTAESGIPGMQFNQWWALVAPAATPPEILERLNKEVVAALAHPATRERLTTLGIDLKGSTREALGNFMRNEVAHWGAVVHRAGITPE